MDRRTRQTSTAAPAQPGGLPLTLEVLEVEEMRPRNRVCGWSLTMVDGGALRQRRCGSFGRQIIAMRAKSQPASAGG